VKVLLDENFPLALLHALRTAGHEAEHIIESGQRGLSDRVIRRRLEEELLLFLTQDEEFLLVPRECRATVLVSRVRQSRPLQQRLEVWMGAIRDYLERRPPQRIFEIADSGALLPWTVAEQ